MAHKMSQKFPTASLDIIQLYTLLLPSHGADKFLEFSVPSSVLFTSTETIRIIRDGEPRTATSTFTQLLSSERVSALLYVYRDHKDY